MDSNALTHALEAPLAKLSISAQEFSELLIRLLDYGVINRDESQVEALLYDRYLQCQALVEDYLTIIHVKILHDSQFCTIRVFPPGAVVPGLPDDEHSPFNSGLRNRPTQQEVAAILVLRVEYENALREGQVDDKGRVMLSLEGFSIALKNLLKRTLPESLPERRQIFKRLKQLRLIDMNSELDVDSPDCWLRIQPAITSFVNDETLSQLASEGAGGVEEGEDEEPLIENPLEGTLFDSLEQDEPAPLSNTAASSDTLAEADDSAQNQQDAGDADVL
ncbi:MAG: hypothetical protein COA42_11045 [Alteromonadaceae bacterium]|nr:MAG: hypothetical protein COA42_11045 [Alteromonadaceae bacterium]